MKTMKTKETAKNEHLVSTSQGDEFLDPRDLVHVGKQAAGRTLQRVLAEMEELQAEKKWEELVALFHPAEEKVPELSAHGLEAPVRAGVAFAMGQMGRYDEAIAELMVCVEKDPDNFRYHSSLAYAAYDSLYAALNRTILLTGKSRAARVALAHAHFERAQALRPEGVTNFYREGMLYRKLEGKTAEALPLFLKAISNWEFLGDSEKERRHQERKNYIKALYQAASALLESSRGEEALATLKRCMAEDEKSGHISLVYKYFALGKIQFHLNRFSEAKDALLFALQCKSPGPRDFVCELLARTWLGLGEAKKAEEAIQRIPEKARRPYVRWTEAEALCALGSINSARAVLLSSLERDGRSKHRTLIRLARIDYLAGEYESALHSASEADRFFREKWGNRFHEGLFWQALCSFRIGNLDEAHALAEELHVQRPGFPKLPLLRRRISQARSQEKNHGSA